MKTFVFPAILLTIFAAACAKPPASIGATYVSPAIYDGRTCQELSEERLGVASALSQAEDEQAGAFVADAVGVFLFLIPVSAFAGDAEDQVATLKGHDRALEQAMLRQRCPGIRRTAGGFPPISTRASARPKTDVRAATSPRPAETAAKVSTSGERLAPPVTYPPDELARFCEQDWDKRTFTDGTVEYNPCPTRRRNSD